jgi:hypothetical protein
MMHGNCQRLCAHWLSLQRPPQDALQRRDCLLAACEPWRVVSACMHVDCQSLFECLIRGLLRILPTWAHIHIVLRRA